MYNSNWNFILKASGVDFGRSITVDDKRKLLEIEEWQYFQHLKEAFLELLKMDPVQMDKDAISTTGHSTIYYDKISIVDAQTQEILLEVGRVTISEALEDKVQAGIFAQLMIAYDVFEKKADIPLSQFQYYLPGTDMIPLARYRFDQSLEVISSHARNMLTLHLSSAEQTLPDQYQFYRLAITHHFDAADAKQHSAVTIQRYHYPELGNAFLDLLETDPKSLDRSLGDEKKYAHFAGIYDRYVELQVEMFCIRNRNLERSIENPGVYLHFGIDPTEFESQVGVKLTYLYENMVKDRLLPLYHYDHELTSLSPLVSMNVLKQRSYISIPPLEGTVSEFPYVLQLDDVTTQGVAPFNSIDESPALYAPSRFATLQDAIGALLELDDRLFSKGEAQAMGHRFYIRHATIYDQLDNKEILSKFMVSSNDPLLRNGMYLQLNDQKGSAEAILAMQHLQTSMPQTGQPVNIIYKMQNAPDPHVKDQANKTAKVKKQYKGPGY